MSKLVEPKRCVTRRKVVEQIRKIETERMTRGGIGLQDPVACEMYNRLLMRYHERLREIGEGYTGLKEPPGEPGR